MEQIKLMDHQSKAVSLSAEQDAYALFMDMGTGKTLCDIIDTKKVQSYPWLIVTRNGVKINWKMEINKWTGDTDVAVLSGTRAQKLKALRSGCRYVVTNYESLYSLHTDLMSIPWKKITFDESSSIKNPKAKCAHYAYLISKAIKRRRILTGTPVGNYPLDLFSQFYILNPAILGFYARPKSKKPISSAFFGFKHKYAEIEYQYHYGRKHEAIKLDEQKRPVFKNLPELKRLIEPYTYTVRKEECLNLPDEMIVFRNIEMAEEQRRIYDELVKESVADIPENEVMSVPNALAKMTRLQQVLGGTVVLDDGKGKRRIPENKTSAVFDILEEIGENKLVIWCRFQDEIEYLQEQLTIGGYKVLTYYGETENRDGAYQDIKDGKYDVLVANAQCGGIGLDFTTATYSIYYSRSFNLIEYLQSMARIYRNGQTKNVTQIIFITENSLEVGLNAALDNKKEFSDYFTTINKGDFIKLLAGEKII